MISERLRDLPEHSHVLDVACGEGYYSRQLAQEFDKDFMADVYKRQDMYIARNNTLFYAFLIAITVESIGVLSLIQLGIIGNPYDCLLYTSS